MESLQQYLISLTAAAFLTALCQAMMPAGTVKRVSCFTCALLLFVVAVRPVLRTDYGTLLDEWEQAYAALAVREENLEQTDLFLLEKLIVEQTEAYIQREAEEQGMKCQVRVSCRMEESLPVPDSVAVAGELSEEKRQRLSQMISADLDIPAERITFTAEEGELEWNGRLSMSVS